MSGDTTRAKPRRVGGTAGSAPACARERIDQGRGLEAQRLSAAGRHDDDAVAAIEHGVHRFALERTEIGEAPDSMERFLQGGVGGFGKHLHQAMDTSSERAGAPAATSERGHANPSECPRCGHAPRTCESEARHRRQFAPGGASARQESPRRRSRRRRLRMPSERSDERREGPAASAIMPSPQTRPLDLAPRAPRLSDRPGAVAGFDVVVDQALEFGGELVMVSPQRHHVPAVDVDRTARFFAGAGKADADVGRLRFSRDH